MKKDIKRGYAAQRRQAYPSIADQLDMIFHDPEAWRAMIEVVKAKHPKPDDA